MLGVIVGRFQVPELTEGHRDLIKTALKECNKILIVLGSPKEGKLSPHDPLPAEIREEMIRNWIDPERLIIKNLEDVGNVPVWNKILDGIIEETWPGQEENILLYGSRDSFLKGYSGKYQTRSVEAKVEISGSEIRERIRKGKPENNRSFREGLIWAIREK